MTKYVQRSLTVYQKFPMSPTTILVFSMTKNQSLAVVQKTEDLRHFSHSVNTSAQVSPSEKNYIKEEVSRLQGVTFSGSLVKTELPKKNLNKNSYPCILNLPYGMVKVRVKMSSLWWSNVNQLVLNFLGVSSPKKRSVAAHLRSQRSTPACRKGNLKLRKRLRFHFSSQNFHSF